LELIILSSLITNKKKYNEIYGSTQQEWNIKIIIDKIKKLNLDYFPKAITSRPIDNEEVLKLIKQGYEKTNIKDELIDNIGDIITEEELIKTYYKLGSYIHSRNPFAQGVKYDGMLKFIKEALNKTIKLLNRYKIVMYDKDYFFHIVMQSIKTGNVGGNIFMKIKSEK
jgi:hypothetical protein